MFVGSKQRLGRIGEMPKMYLQGQLLANKTSVKYLGLIIDQHLTWDDHVSGLCKRLRPKIGLLSRIRHILPFPQLMTVYLTTVQSVIDYGLNVWGSCNVRNRKMVQSLQNRCVRLITNNFDHDVRSTFLIKELDLMTNDQRYQFYIGILVHKCLNGMAPTYLSDQFTFIRDLHEHNTRNEHLLLIPPSLTNAMKRSFAHSAASLWNKLPLSCYEAPSFNHFKRVLRNSIISTS